VEWLYVYKNDSIAVLGFELESFSSPDTCGNLLVVGKPPCPLEPGDCAGVYVCCGRVDV